MWGFGDKELGFRVPGRLHLPGPAKAWYSGKPEGLWEGVTGPRMGQAGE